MAANDNGTPRRRKMDRLPERFYRDVWLLIISGVVFWALASAQSDRVDRGRETQRTTQALCALRGDLERRVVSSQDFLVEHPNGVLGISAKVIRDGIANQQRTIDALSALKC
jgi:hypothetical protein